MRGSLNENEDFETEEEADDAKEVDEAEEAEEVEEDVVDAAALVGDVDGSDSTLDGHPSSRLRGDFQKRPKK